MLANVSFANIDQPIEIIGTLSLSYAGFGRTPAYSVNSAGSLSFLYTDNNTGLSLGSTAPKNIGNYKVKITLIDGPDVGFFVETNYTIIKKLITLTATTNTKVYDGTISATATPTITLGSLASGDVGTYSEAYDTKIHGSSKILTPSVVSILDATSVSMLGNYSVTYVTNTSGVITQLPITLTASANTKVYDGTISATAIPTLTGTLASGDVGTYSETYDTKSQGLNKILTPTAIILDATSVSMLGNYSVTFVTNTSGVITQLPITLTASANTKVYDGTISATAIPTLTGTLVSGDVGTYSETYDTKSQGLNKILTPTAIILDATSTSVVGNYSITYATNTSGVITKLPITITASTNTKVYDGNVSATAAPTITAGSLVVGDIGTYSETYDTKAQGTNKTITASVVSILDATSTSVVGNYSITYLTNTSGVITKLPIIVTATASDKVYDANKSATVSLSSNKLGSDVVTIAKTLAEFVTKDVGVSKQVNITGITISGADAGNYTLTSSTAIGTASITAKILTITAEDKSKLYGAAVPVLTYTYTGLVSGDVLPLTTISTTALASSPVDSYPIIVSAAADANYTINYVPGILIVNKVPLIITADNNTRVYGAIDPIFTYTYSGLVNGDVAPATLPSISTTALASSPAGSYPIIPSAATDPNYTITYVNGILTVTKAALTIKAKPHTITYNGTAYSGGNGVIPTGFASGESISNLNGTLTYGGTSQGAKNAGTYTIIPDGLSSPNYNISYVGDNLEIKKATLNVLAGNQSVEYGTQLAKILSDAQSNYSGFVGGDDATVISGAVSYLTNYTSSVSAGTTGIFLEPKITGLTSANYDFVAVNGTITITAAPNSYFQIPNAFVPGSSNEFDNKFRVFSNSGFPSNLFVSLSIYNRSGKFLKKLESITESWDGRIEGVLQEADVYLWTAIFIDDPLTKKIPRSGTFILLK